MAKQQPVRTLINVKVTPKSSKTEVVSIGSDEICIRVAAIPDKGEANTELISFLAKHLKIPKSNISIAKGHTSRYKKLEILGMDKETLIQLLVTK